MHFMCGMYKQAESILSVPPEQHGAA